MVLCSSSSADSSFLFEDFFSDVSLSSSSIFFAEMIFFPGDFFLDFTTSLFIIGFFFDLSLTLSFLGVKEPFLDLDFKDFFGDFLINFSSFFILLMLGDFELILIFSSDFTFFSSFFG